MTEITIYNVQRAVTAKVDKSVMVLVCKNISNGFQVTVSNTILSQTDEQTDIHGKNNMSPDPERWGRRDRT